VPCALPAQPAEPRAQCGLGHGGGRHEGGVLDPGPEQVRAHWQRVTEMLRKQFPTAALVMEAALDDVLAFLHFPQEHWCKISSNNPLELLNKEIKRRTNVVGIFPNDAAITRLVGSQLLEQQQEWQLERQRFFSAATMAKIPEPEEALELTDGDSSAQLAVSSR
jgi:putative transposase